MPPTKRDVLAQLLRDELLVALDQYGLQVADRRVKDDLVDGSIIFQKDGY